MRRKKMHYYLCRKLLNRQFTLSYNCWMQFQTINWSCLRTKVLKPKQHWQVNKQKMMTTNTKFDGNHSNGMKISSSAFPFQCIECPSNSMVSFVCYSLDVSKRFSTFFLHLFRTRSLSLPVDRAHFCHFKSIQNWKYLCEDKGCHKLACFTQNK